MEKIINIKKAKWRVVLQWIVEILHSKLSSAKLSAIAGELFCIDILTQRKNSWKIDADSRYIQICICKNFTLPLRTSATEPEKWTVAFILILFCILSRSGYWCYILCWCVILCRKSNGNLIRRKKKRLRLAIGLSAILHRLDKRVAGMFSVFLQWELFFFICHVNINGHVEVFFFFFRLVQNDMNLWNLVLGKIHCKILKTKKKASKAFNVQLILTCNFARNFQIVATNICSVASPSHSPLFMITSRHWFLFAFLMNFFLCLFVFVSPLIRLDLMRFMRIWTTIFFLFFHFVSVFLSLSSQLR